MKPMFRLIALAAAMGLLTGGCATAPQPRNGLRRGLVLIPEASVNALVQGMSEAQVLQILGAPHQRRPYRPGGAGAEIWTYRLSSTEAVMMVPVTTQAAPANDPLTGQPTTRQEPVYQNQHVVTYETLELLFLDGLLTQRTAGRDAERWFD